MKTLCAETDRLTGIGHVAKSCRRIAPVARLDLNLMSDISCVRCGNTRAQIHAPPLPGELGNRIFDSICQACWNEWLREQTAIMNHYALDPRQPQTRQFLAQQTETFLFGTPQK